MWKNVLSGLILENIESLKHYQDMKGDHGNTVESILEYVSGVIATFPWYFRFPVIMLANVIGLLCLITTGRSLNMLSSEKRSSFLLRVQYIPSFDMLNKLVRSMSFLKLFDCLPMTPDRLDSVKCENN